MFPISISNPKLSYNCSKNGNLLLLTLVVERLVPWFHEQLLRVLTLLIVQR